ncbi:hypothetical protein F6X50_20795 [Dickeya dianthicola]|uniref:Uncharacterized protein n=1 Tax=Dickeya dianthicola TaxID=204039 RepID=A0AAX1C835_9GAMM|nr:hypothetical protein [Dickeya dianthicola]MBI0451569.1 hypothetical protein [Dickeya dianthicola]MBI0455927.1 hypothetical protein [Dickeya dianthicola]MBI0460275.1 hypothetical protein [Dickeya dianthicola]MBI0464607.1 hypothetical protein [Dickeya dianthicola]
MVTLTASGEEPVKPLCGEAGSAIAPFGLVSLCVLEHVVDPGRSRALWPQPEEANSFPGASTFLAQQILCLFRSFTVFRSQAMRPARLLPFGSPQRTRQARP